MSKEFRRKTDVQYIGTMQDNLNTLTGYGARPEKATLAPARGVTVRGKNEGESLQYREVNERTRYLTEDELERLLSECPVHLKRIVICAVNTGMDRGEILKLKWSQIRDGFVYLGKYKTRPVRQIPINDDFDQVFNDIRIENDIISKHDRTIKRLKAVDKKVSEYVFTYGGRKIERVDRAFQTALDKAGIEDFRFKDLRHTFASHVLIRGGTLKDVQELLGHKNISMTMRYAHLSPEHKNKAVNLLNGLTAPTKKPSDVILSQNVTFLKTEKSHVG